MSKLSPLSPQNESVVGSYKSLAPRFEKMMAAYATVASAAAGIALLAAPAAEAKIVYTATNKSATSPIQIDLNHDGIVDFEIEFCDRCVPHAAILQVALNVTGNKVRSLQPNGGEAAALQKGAPIGPAQSFASSTAGYGGVFMADAGSYGSVVYSNGPWLNATNRYLGLKFLINGQVHFGWARVTSTDRLGHVVLTGYAYETTPNKGLRAGQTSDSPNVAMNETSLPESRSSGASLGLLARGADALEIWRRPPVETTAL